MLIGDSVRLHDSDVVSIHIHLEKVKALEFAEELTTPVGCGTMVGAEGFDGSDVDPARVRQARQAWASRTACKGVTADNV